MCFLYCAGKPIFMFAIHCCTLFLRPYTGPACTVHCTATHSTPPPPPYPRRRRRAARRRRRAARCLGHPQFPLFPPPPSVSAVLGGSDAFLPPLRVHGKQGGGCASPFFSFVSLQYSLCMLVTPLSFLCATPRALLTYIRWCVSPFHARCAHRCPPPRACARQIRQQTLARTAT